MTFPHYSSAFNPCSTRPIVKTKSQIPFSHVPQPWPVISSWIKVGFMFSMATSIMEIFYITESAAGWLSTPRLIGDRAYDAANALRNPLSLPEIVQNRERLSVKAQIMATVLDIDRERLLSYAFAHACLSACWSLEDGRDPSHSLAVAVIAESFIDSPALRIPHRNGSRIFRKTGYRTFRRGVLAPCLQLYRYIK